MNRRHVQVTAWATAAVVAVGTAVVVGLAERLPTPEVRLHQGAVWLVSNRIGQLTLLDGPSEEVAAQVAVAAPDTDLAVVQGGATGYAVDRRAGTVTRVDGATFTASPPTEPLPGAQDRLSVVAAEDTLYVLNAERGLIAEADPRSLAPRDTQSLTAEVSPGGLVTDDGVLWALDDTGALARYADGNRTVREKAGRGRLVVADGPVLVDRERLSADVLDPRTGDVRRTVRLDVQADEQFAVAGSPTRLMLSIGGRALFVSCPLDADVCSPPVDLLPVDLPGQSLDLGAAVEAHGRAFVPDYTRGHVLVVGSTGEPVLDVPVFDGGKRFELIERDGYVFFNDPDSEQAGVITLDGQVRRVDKYDPVDPGAGRTEAPDDGERPDTPSDPDRPGVGDPVGPDRNPPGGVVSIVVSPGTTVRVGQEAQFTVRSTIGALSSAEWAFGDGATADGITVRHRWDRPGTFRVSASAVRTSGQRTPITTATMTVLPADGAARIDRLNVQPPAPLTGEVVTFGADVTGVPDRWEWTVTGPDGEVTSDQPTLQRTFATPGEHTATLRVTAGGVTDERSTPVQVSAPLRQLSCGDVVTESAVLAEDLTCPSGTGLTVGGDDVVLDLGGNTVTAPTGVAANGVSGTTIRNGAVVSDPGVGVVLTGTTGAALTDLIVPSGVRGDAATTTGLTRVTMTGAGAQVSFVGSSVTLSSSTVGVGTFVCTVSSSCAFDNTVLTANVVTCQDDAASAITVRGGRIATTGRVRCFTVALRAVPDVRVTEIVASDLEITDSTVTDLLVIATTVLIERNTFTGGEYGMEIHDDPQVPWPFLTGGTIRGNSFDANGGVGLIINVLNERPGPVVVDGNTVTANGNDSDSQVHDKGGQRVRDGMRIYVGQASDIVVRNNTAVDNNEFGIWIGPNANSARDEGGNRGSGNSSGCFNVACS